MTRHTARRLASAFVLAAGALTVATSSPAGADSHTLVINEIDYDQVGSDTAEYLEIKNTGTAAVDLSGVSLIFVNGANGTVYDTIALPAVSLAAGDYFVVCANAATVANCDLDDAPNTDFIQNGAPDAARLVRGETVLDVVSYEGSTTGHVEGTGTSAADSNTVVGSIARCPDGVDTNDNDADFEFTSTITPGATNSCPEPPPPPPPPTATKIHEIQGSGAAVTGAGPFVVEAVVVGDFQTQGSGELRGFFLQEENADVDANAATSEGIFVFCGGCPVDVNVGDQVRVSGSASEFFGMSQLSATTADAVTVLSSGNPLPTPAVVDLPASGSYRAETTFEAFEGMLVTFADELYVSEYFELARYGQLVLTADARPRQFTDQAEPSVDGYADFLAELNSNRIILDDDNNIQNDAVVPAAGPDEPYYWPRPGLSNDNYVRGGDSIDGLTGVMHWSFAGQNGTDAWRIRPVEPAFQYTFTSNNERPTEPADVGGSLKVASFNVLNYFTTINSRGADSLAELDRQRAKIAAAICGMDADIVGLIEIENNGSEAITDLLDGDEGVNELCGEYAFVDTGVIGTDEIAVAFIYRPDTVSTVGDFAVLDSSVDPRFLDSENRPALAQTFRETATNGVVTVVVNHLKSKGSACTDIGDPDLGDGQGNCNLTREAAAEAMVDWLASDPTGAGDADVLIIGDLNSYRNEDPIDAIEEGADDVAGTGDDYVDLLDHYLGDDAYSYVFDGQLGYLDHALANVNLAQQVTGATVWHINADEIPVFDYNDEIDDGSAESSFERESDALPIYEPNAYRASDHDPVIVGLDLNGSPVCTAAEASVASLLVPNHKLVDVDVLGVTDPEGDDVGITITSIFQDEPVNGDDDGDTSPDGFGVGTATAQVRAERDGEGNGRVYHITFVAIDELGGSCGGEVLVEVPVGRGANTVVVDDGPLYDSTAS